MAATLVSFTSVLKRTLRLISPLDAEFRERGFRANGVQLLGSAFYWVGRAIERKWKAESGWCLACDAEPGEPCFDADCPPRLAPGEVYEWTPPAGNRNSALLAMLPKGGA